MGADIAQERTEQRTMLRAWRLRQGWSLEEVADLTGLSVGQLSKIERGQHMPRPRMRIRIARALGARVGQIFPPAIDEKRVGPR